MYCFILLLSVSLYKKEHLKMMCYFSARGSEM